MFNSAPPLTFGPDPTKSYGGLTAQQYAYCECRAAGMGKGEAYREAYDQQDAPANDHSIKERAWQLECRTDITGTINRMVAARRKDSTLVPLVDRSFVLEGITRLALTATKENVQLQAYLTLAKLPEIGLLRDEAPQSKPRTIEEIDKELRERLAELANVARVIDGTATVTKPAAPAAAPAPGDRRRKPKA